ncbi:hypothetical protein Stube_22900 [Streptomyces tubercidicus]|uniref:Gram-positive cocci surface proteins LPxTG domain-containing protein n=1 Tax=Streptomyces tubercidicus TaxID=47759 RepID=A0A640UPC8_9ACTN|nr:hypothetical protein Stube_22900 [Streptomyces tubercidicus]
MEGARLPRDPLRSLTSAVNGQFAAPTRGIAYVTARRPLLTAATAGSVLFALWFVPSANATAGHDGATDSALHMASAPAGPALADRTATGAQDTDGRSTTATQDGGDAGTGTGTDGRPTGSPHLLADTGSPDTTPYVIGGAACLALGAGLVSYSVRRTRDETA